MSFDVHLHICYAFQGLQGAKVPCSLDLGRQANRGINIQEAFGKAAHAPHLMRASVGKSSGIAKGFLGIFLPFARVRIAQLFAFGLSCAPIAVFDIVGSALIHRDLLGGLLGGFGRLSDAGGLLWGWLLLGARLSLSCWLLFACPCLLLGLASNCNVDGLQH